MGDKVGDKLEDMLGYAAQDTVEDNEDKVGESATQPAELAATRKGLSRQLRNSGTVN